jgi:hypothetical protein
VICKERSELLEGLLEESCREDGGEFLQVDRLAMSVICRGQISDKRKSHTCDAGTAQQGRTMRKGLFVGPISCVVGLDLVWRGPYRCWEGFSLGFPQP